MADTCCPSRPFVYFPLIVIIIVVVVVIVVVHTFFVLVFTKHQQAETITMPEFWPAKKRRRKRSRRRRRRRRRRSEFPHGNTCMRWRRIYMHTRARFESFESRETRLEKVRGVEMRRGVVRGRECVQRLGIEYNRA